MWFFGLSRRQNHISSIKNHLRWFHLKNQFWAIRWFHMEPYQEPLKNPLDHRWFNLEPYQEPLEEPSDHWWFQTEPKQNHLGKGWVTLGCNEVIDINEMLWMITGTHGLGCWWISKVFKNFLLPSKMAHQETQGIMGLWWHHINISWFYMEPLWNP